MTGVRLIPILGLVLIISGLIVGIFAFKKPEHFIWGQFNKYQVSPILVANSRKNRIKFVKYVAAPLIILITSSFLIMLLWAIISET